MESKQFRKYLQVAWKWYQFPGWLVWFFLSFPWQIQKGYSQFVAATTLISPASYVEPEDNIYQVSSKSFANFN
jgi:hypothetical protein